MEMSMEYEYLLRDAFDCGRCRDPFGLANADVFDNNVHPKIGHRLQFGISAAIKKISHDFALGEDFKAELEKLDEKVWHPEVSQQDLVYVINRVREIFSHAEREE